MTTKFNLLSDDLYTLVQHTGYASGEKPEFQLAVEERKLSKKAAEKIQRAGGVILTGYAEATAQVMRENYPPGVGGLIPRVRGRFHGRIRVDGLKLYLPDPALGLVREGESETLRVRVLRRFRVASVSSNANEFGLHGMILMTKEGEAWEVASNQLHLRSKGEEFDVPVQPNGEPNWATLGFEIPNRLPHVPEGVLKEVFA